MKLDTSKHGDVTVLSIAGEFNADTVSKFKNVVSNAGSGECRDFVVDLKAVTTIDSAGLEALTALQRQCEEQLGMVRLCGADETLKKILEITRLDKLLIAHEDLDEALAEFVTT